MAATKKRRSGKKVIAYPPNIHILKFNIQLHNQSEDDVYEYVAKMQNFIQDNFPPGTAASYEMNEIVRKGR